MPAWAVLHENKLSMNGCAAFLARHASRHGNPMALMHCNRQGDLQSLSWLELAGQVAQQLDAIDRLGLAPRDRVVHALGNTADGVAVALASLIAGTIEVPLPPFAQTGSFDSAQALIGGTWLERDAIRRPGHVPDFISLQAREQQHDAHHPALILFTSGSTGQPRGVTLSRLNLFSNARAKLAAAPQRIDDRRLTVLPLYHAYARTCDLMTWLLSGGTLGVAAGWEGWQRLAPILKPTLINTVPSLARRLLAAEGMETEAASQLRIIGCGGAAIDSDSFARFTALGVTVIQGYGLTEASPVVCSATPSNARADRVGCPVAGCETRIGADGRLAIRGNGVMLGYWNDPLATAEKIADGWLDTGDCVEVDPSDGQLRILGRVDDRITLSNGLKFFPGSIEKCVASLPGIRHALLIPNDRHVDLFIDVAPELRPITGGTVDIEQALQQFPSWQRPRRILITARPLAETPGATTAKGTLCRPVAVAVCRAQPIPVNLDCQNNEIQAQDASD